MNGNLALQSRACILPFAEDELAVTLERSKSDDVWATRLALGDDLLAGAAENIQYQHRQVY